MSTQEHTEVSRCCLRHQVPSGVLWKGKMLSIDRKKISGGSQHIKHSPIHEMCSIQFPIAYLSFHMMCLSQQNKILKGWDWTTRPYKSTHHSLLQLVKQKKGKYGRNWALQRSMGVKHLMDVYQQLLIYYSGNPRIKTHQRLEWPKCATCHVPSGFLDELPLHPLGSVN